MEKKVYNVKNKINELYDKCIKIADGKKMGILVSVLFAVSLIPIVYVGLHNYASGDDYWFSVFTYRAWVETGSLWEALKASARMVAKMYIEWQGTWFTLFLFTLSPNNFVENGYILTVFIGLGLLIGSFAYLADYYLVKKLQFTKGAAAIITCMTLYLIIQYMPRTTSGIFWFNGIMHYSVPLILGVFAIVHSQKYVEHKKVKDYIIVFICFALLGGGSYLAPICASLTVVLILICQLEIKELDVKKKKISLSYDWRNLWILPIFVVELAGLAISFLAPGNNVRGGEEFGFSVKWAIECIYYAIDRGIYLGIDYFTENPFTLVVFVLIAFVLWHQMWRIDTEKFKFRFPLLFVIYMNGIYWAAYAPEIYSRSDVSGGVQNTYMQFFFLITLANMIYVHGWLQRMLRTYWKKNAESTGKEWKTFMYESILGPEKYKRHILVPVVIIGCVVFLGMRYYVDITTTNEHCVEYIVSGKMERYEEIRREQHRILSDTNIKDAIVPEMAVPYPILHMELSTNENFESNKDRAQYYNKNSVKAVMVE